MKKFMSKHKVITLAVDVSEKGIAVFAIQRNCRICSSFKFVKAPCKR